MPRSIGGFNSSTYGSFGEGDPISARALNRLAVGIDRASTMPSQGIQFVANNGGVTYNDPQEVVFLDGMGVAPATEKVNHYECKVVNIDGVFALKIARSGNIWRPIDSECDSQYRTESITAGPLVTLTTGTDPVSPWASNDGYVALSGPSLFVYAYQVETATACDFYIYVSLDPGLDALCPVSLPDGIDAPTEAYTVQVIRIADIVADGEGWIVSQFVLGAITWPQTVGGAGNEYVNQFELAIKTVDSVPVLKVASGGHIYRPVSSTCDKTEFTDVITPDPSGPSPVVVVTGTGTSVPWASDDGYVEISAGAYYVYAFKVESESGASFYIYVSKDGTLDESCPVALRPPMAEPSEPYTVQCLKIGSATYADGVWTIDQKLIGSITWPSNQSVQIPEQFETRVLASTEEGVWKVQVARGRVIVGGGRQAVGEYDVQGFAIYPTGSKVNGSDSESPYVNQGGYVKISNADYDGSNTWGVYIVSNPSEGNYPMMAVIADGSDADTKSRPWTTRVAWIDVCPYTVSVITTPTPPYEVYLKSYDTVSSQHQANYNCQRIKIATLYWNSGTSNWIVRQWLIGSLTNPSIEWWNGNREYNSDDGIPDWATTTDYQTEQDAWLGPWTGYYKWDGSGAYPSVNILP